jgi:hypothetical protein
MGSSSAPEPDPNIGLAALKSAETGEQLLSWMKDQAEITNKWAKADRERYVQKFIPQQDKYIKEANTWDSESRKMARVGQAVSDVRQQQKIAEGTRVRQAMAMGIDPRSGRFGSSARQAAMDGSLAAAGAGNMARRQVEAEAEAKRANVINMGSGMAVNPATSIGLSNNALAAGGQGAMQGYNQQGSLLNTQYQGQLQSWQASQNSQSGLFGALGGIAGMFGQSIPGLAMLSSKKAKTDKKPVAKGAALGAIREMPIEQWRYKPGMGDGGQQQHISTYAEDFAKATGQGDGKTIDVASAIGVTMGAIKDLDAKVDRIAGMRRAA